MNKYPAISALWQVITKDTYHYSTTSHAAHFVMFSGAGMLMGYDMEKKMWDKKEMFQGSVLCGSFSIIAGYSPVISVFADWAMLIAALTK